MGGEWGVRGGGGGGVGGGGGGRCPNEGWGWGVVDRDGFIEHYGSTLVDLLHYRLTLSPQDCLYFSGYIRNLMMFC